MILEAARAAAANMTSPPFRGLILKSLGLTIAALIALWLALTALVDWLAVPWIHSLVSGSWAAWLGPIAVIATALVLAIGLALLIAPATALVAGLFADDAAEAVERADYPGDRPGRAMPFVAGLVTSLKFFGIVVVGNCLALLLLVVPGINVGAFLLVNGYLIGRETFEFAAMRQRPEDEAKALRHRYRGTVFLAGLIVAGLMTVPVLNLLAPLFACAMMVHLHKAIESKEAASGQRRF